jgi:WD40 repeat protein
MISSSLEKNSKKLYSFIISILYKMSGAWARALKGGLHLDENLFTSTVDDEDEVNDDNNDEDDNNNNDDEDDDDKLSVIEERLLKTSAVSSVGWTSASLDEALGKPSPTTSSSGPAPLSVLPSSSKIDKLSFLVTASRPQIAAISKPNDAPTSFEGRQRLLGKGTKQGASSLPVTFKAKVKGSGYGGIAPLRPAWAKASAARVSSKSRNGSEKVVIDLINHKYPGKLLNDESTSTLPVSLDMFVFPDARSSSIRDVTGVTSGGSGGSGGELRSSVKQAPQSQSFLPLGPVTCVAFSDDGSSFCAASHDGSAFSLSLSLERKSSSSLLQLKAAHSTITRHSHTDDETSGPMAKVSWSHATYRELVPRRAGSSTSSAATSSSSVDHHHLLITTGGGGQKSASLWAGGANGSNVPLFIMKGPGFIGSGVGGVVGGGEAPEQYYQSPVTSANFYYEDKFIITSSGDKLFASTWALDTAANSIDMGGVKGYGGSEDILRLKRKFINKSCARLSTSVQVAEGGTSIVSIAAHNSFRSPLIFSACSDRSIRVFDMGAPGGAPQEVLLVPDAHGKQIKSLSLPSSSCYADVSGASLNCFLTSSTDSVAGGGSGLLRLWDIRANRCARQLFGGHVNRVHALAAALSPDLVYVATGSEDRSCVIYDLRTSAHVAKLSGATDSVTSVAWHPLTSSLASGSLDGGVRFYSV